MNEKNVIALLLTFALALSACQSPSSLTVLTVQPQRAQIPALDDEIGMRREPNLAHRLDLILSPLPRMATMPSDN